MPRSKEISEDLRKKVVDAHEAGKGYKTIAKNFDLHLSTVRQIVHRWKKFNTIVTRPRSGRPTKMATILREVTKTVSERTSSKEPDIESLRGTERSSVGEMRGVSVTADKELETGHIGDEGDPSDRTVAEDLPCLSDTNSSRNIMDQSLWLTQESATSVQQNSSILRTLSKKTRARKIKARGPELFSKPFLVPHTADTASIIFIIPKEEVDPITSEPADQQSSVTEEELCCDICDMCFPNETELETHQKTHLEETALECEDCGKVYNSASKIQKHRAKKHNKMCYTCEICGLQYNYRSQYVLHQRSQIGEKPFRCNECGQAFVHECSLVIHQRIHTGSVQNT